MKTFRFRWRTYTSPRPEVPTLLLASGAFMVTRGRYPRIVQGDGFWPEPSYRSNFASGRRRMWGGGTHCDVATSMLSGKTSWAAPLREWLVPLCVSNLERFCTKRAWVSLALVF